MDQIESWLAYLCCPGCLADLVAMGESLACTSCGWVYPVFAGIPDLRRKAPDAREMRRVEQLLERFDSSDFRGLMGFYIDETTKDALLDVELDYELEWACRGAKQLYRIEAMTSELGGESVDLDHVRGLYLDIGCGKGAMLATMASRCDRAIGLDYSLEYLILARKLFQELGADNVFLVAGSNLELPLRSGCASLLTSIDVIEHIPDQAKGMAEDTRVVEPGGVIYMNSPNRYSVFAVEDHVRLWGVGFVPRRWMKAYVKARSGLSYEGVWLMSYRQLRRLAREHSDNYAIRGALFDPSSPDLSSRERILARSKRLLSLFDTFFRYVLPSHLLMMRKAPAPAAEEAARLAPAA